MPGQLEKLREQAEILFEQEKFKELIELLDDGILEEYKDAPLYAWKARAYYRLENWRQSLGYAQRAIEIGADYWMGYLARGVSLKGLGDADKAIVDYNEAIRLKPDDAIAFNQRGNAWNTKGEYDKAIADYDEAIKLDADGAIAYNNRANAWTNKGDYDKGLADLDRAIKLKPEYTKAYTNRGIAWAKKGEYDKAIVDYDEAIRLEPDKWKAYYNRALAWKDKGAYDKAIKDFQTALELIPSTENIWAERAKETIAELRVLQEDMALKEISGIIDAIKKLLLFQDGCVTHYTTLSTARKLLLEDSEFRISEGAFLNDTSEGRELFDFFGIVFTKRVDGKSAEQFARKPFIGSFVEEKKHDDLNLWRMYGKENQEEAKGCALTLRAGAFVEGINNKITPVDAGQTMKPEEDINFYRVAYRTEGAEEFTIPELNEKEGGLNGLMRRLKEKVKQYDEERHDNSADMKKLEEYLNRIAFLFKSDVYKSENELRLVIRGMAGIETVIDKTQTPPRVFINLVNIKPMVEKITLGPKVEKKDEWAAAFYYSYDKEERKPEILISHLPFK